MFFQGSRYEKVETSEWTDASGQPRRFKQTRYIVEPVSSELHTITQGERVDQIAHRYLQDPERFWRIADANLVVEPESLTERPGQTIRIPTAEG